MKVLLLFSPNPNTLDVSEINGICMPYNLPEGLQPIPGLTLDSHPHNDCVLEIARTMVLATNHETHGIRTIVFVQAFEKRRRRKYDIDRTTFLVRGWQCYRLADRETAAKPLAA